ncbi:hypothetical protein [Streptomyces purpureus]|nr:hypothetical protein [Streptomyces purpureus]
MNDPSTWSTRGSSALLWRNADSVPLPAPGRLPVTGHSTETAPRLPT